jgi:hypothetical protein
LGGRSTYTRSNHSLETIFSVDQKSLRSFDQLAICTVNMKRQQIKHYACKGSFVMFAFFSTYKGVLSHWSRMFKLISFSSVRYLNKNKQVNMNDERQEYKIKA